jgi:hypothetical protein
MKKNLIKKFIPFLLMCVLIISSTLVVSAGTSIPTTSKRIYNDSYSGSGHSTMGDLYSNYLFYGDLDYRLTVTNSSDYSSWVEVYSKTYGTLKKQLNVPAHSTKYIDFTTHTSSESVYFLFSGPVTFTYTIQGL